MRPFAETDLDTYAEICADPEVMRFLGGKTWNRMETWRHIATTLGHWQLRGYGPWAVERRDNGELIGRVGFINPEGWPGFELGWTLARSAWGHGFATEAAARALEHAFTEMDRDHVISLIHPDNKSSLAVAKRLGEKFERTIEVLGEEVGLYGIHQQDWRGRLDSIPSSIGLGIQKGKNMEDQEVAKETTELEANLDRVEGERRFVVENVGTVSAQGVRFSVQSERDKNAPVSAHDLKSAFPVEELKPGEKVSIGAIITPGTGLHFRGVVTWRNPDGSEQERVYYISA